jgi:hypothetical protein
LKYNSAQRQNARIKSKLRRWPIPKYLRIRKTVRPEADKKPLRLWAKIVEKVNKKLKKIRIKKIGTAQITSGSTK